MPHPIEASTLRILKPTGETVGTGFLVSKNLAVTCAHVVKILGAGAGDTIDIRFTGKNTSTAAHVLPEYWRPDALTDIAILHVDDVPEGVFPLRMGRASESRLKNDLYTFGYAIAADEQGIGGLGTFITLKQEGNFIQFRMHEANHGHSGAPIFDDKRGVVVGMIKKGHTGTGRNAETTFAIPTETIWQVCPQLRPIISPLPRRNPIVEGINLLPYDYDQRIQNFLTEYLGTDSHPVPFGGRDDALKMLDTWLAESTPYLLLAAPAGRGKSALLVRWLDSLKAREDLALAFVPVSIRFGTNMERVFYAALAARLAFLHGDDVPASPETSTAVYRGLVADYLSKPLANDRTLLVVLDGLDEAADWQAGADFMPGELPAGVRVVVSARFLTGDSDSNIWLRCLNWERNELASAPFLIPLDRDGVADVLLKMGCPLDELSRQVDIVAELYRLSEGDPLLVGLYVGDLWAKGEAVTRLKPEDLAGVQPGYKGYFDRWWDDQKKLWGKDKPWLEKHVRAVRNLLAGALGTLLRDDFQALEPELESDYIVDAVDVLQRFIIGDNQNQGYTLSHPKLGQYFWEDLTLTEQAQVEEQFLAWCERTFQEFVYSKRDPKEKAEVPVYVVRNYGAHLTRANSPIEKWLPLIHHQQWAQAWFTVEGAYGGYLQDVQQVWERCQIKDEHCFETSNAPIYINEQIRCALIESSLHSLAANIPIILIPALLKTKTWTLPQVWAFIHQLPSSQQQSRAIVSILPYLTKDQLSKTLEIAWMIKDDWYRGMALSAMTQTLSDYDIEKISNFLIATKDEKNRAKLLVLLAQHLPERYLERYFQKIIQLNNERIRTSVLRKLTERLPSEHLEKILELVKTLNDQTDRLVILQKLADRFPVTKIEKVVIQAKALLSEASYASVLHQAGGRISEEGLIELVKIARTMSVNLSCAHLWFTLAWRLPQIRPEALEKIRSLHDDTERLKLLVMFARLSPEIGQEIVSELERTNQLPESMRLLLLKDLLQNVSVYNTKTAIALAQQISNTDIEILVLCSLVKVIPNIGREALHLSSSLSDEKKRIAALTDLCRLLPEKILIHLLEPACSINDPRGQIHLLKILAQRIHLSNIQNVKIASQSVSDTKSKLIILSMMANRSDALIDDALKISRVISDEEAQSRFLISLALDAPQIYPAAFTVTLKIQDEDIRASHLMALVKSAPQHELDTLLNIALNIDNQRARSRLLVHLIQHYPDDATEHLLKKIREHVDSSSRIRCLTVIMRKFLAKANELGNEVVNVAINEFVTDNKPDLLVYLAQNLPVDELPKIISFLHSTQPSGRWYARILVILAGRVPIDKLDDLLHLSLTIPDQGTMVLSLSSIMSRLNTIKINMIYELTFRMTDQSAKAQLLIKLSEHKPEIIEEVLSLLNNLNDETQKYSFLMDLAQYVTSDNAKHMVNFVNNLPNLEIRAQVMGELAKRFPEMSLSVLEIAQMITSKTVQARILGNLIPQWPENQLDKVLAYLRTINDPKLCAFLLQLLLQRAGKEKATDIYEISKTFHDNNARTLIMSELASLMPNVVGEVLQSVRTIEYGKREKVLRNIRGCKIKCVNGLSSK